MTDTVTWTARAGRLNRLLREWPASGDITLGPVELVDGGAVLRGYVECEGWGWREAAVVVPDAWLADANLDLAGEVRALFRAARQREEARWQSQVLEA